MKRDCDEYIYGLYNSFLEKVFINKTDFFDENRGLDISGNINTCIACFIGNENNEKISFEEKARKQFDGKSEEVKRLFSHAVWLWGFAVNESKNCDLIFITENIKRAEHGFANGGPYHLSNKYREICFCLRLFAAVARKDCNNTDDIKKYIEKLCLGCSYPDIYSDEDIEEFVSEYNKFCSMVNILLYLSAPDKYERIVSKGHKQKIVNCFGNLLSDDEKQEFTDKKISLIRNKLEGINGLENFDFYENDKIRSLWDLSSSDGDSDEFEGLKFKKNIIFYGPPGTSKTYSAKQLASAFIVREMLTSKKITMADYLVNKVDTGKYIKILQLHANYSYDNFIICQTVKEGSVETQKGFFTELCEAAANDREHPYVLILDEINRADIAKLFGEAFSAVENRDEEIILPYKQNGEYVRLSVPANLYIIGTMNEIDFSLERLDFALRRRFLWFKHGFDRSVLYDMLDGTDENDKQYFIGRAEKLNEKIRNTRELGGQYEIGHVFFAEIKNIAEICQTKRLYRKYSGRFIPKEPVEVLWKVSVKPMLESYLDNVDADTKNDILKAAENIYYGKED